MPSCLITGATGFVGSNLASRLCESGWSVRCLRRATSSSANLDGLPVEQTVGALDDPGSIRQAVDGVDVVFHLAGRTSGIRYAEFHRDNADGTRAVAEACLDRQTKPTLVFCSSMAAGGPSEEGRPRVESEPARPVSEYGRSKLAAEEALLEFAEKLAVSILRPPIIFGPADRASLAMYQGIRNLRLHPLPGYRRFPVSLIHAADLAAAFEMVAERGERLRKDGPPGQGVYYAAAERSIGYGEMGRLAAAAYGKSVVALPMPKFLFRLAGRGGTLKGRITGRPGLVNRDKIREAVAPGWVCSDAKLRGLGYSQASPLEQRFAETVAWYREHGWL
ncbi:MAG: NAD-dependent epimerase/dehydratase family protein [Planctomycetota bacterium]